MKKIRLKIGFRLAAVLDVLFAERFELKIFKNGRLRSSTKFCSKEIDELI